MAIPVEEINYFQANDMKQVSWTTHKEKVPLTEALAQLADVCEGYIPKKATFPELEEHVEKVDGYDQIALLGKDGSLIAIVEVDAEGKNPTLDSINATSADFYALIAHIDRKKLVNLKKNQTLRTFLKRVPKP